MTPVRHNAVVPTVSRTPNDFHPAVEKPKGAACALSLLHSGFLLHVSVTCCADSLLLSALPPPF